MVLQVDNGRAYIPILNSQSLLLAYDLMGFGLALHMMVRISV